MVIEKGVPIPYSKATGPRTAITKLVRQMVPGESILIPSRADYDTARKVLTQMRAKPVTRKVDGGWRVWRTA